MNRYETAVVTRPHPASQKLPLCRDSTQMLADNTRPGYERSPQCVVTVITLSTETKYLWAQIALSYCEAHWGPACNQGPGRHQLSSLGLKPSLPSVSTRWKICLFDSSLTPRWFIFIRKFKFSQDYMKKIYWKWTRKLLCNKFSWIPNAQSIHWQAMGEHCTKSLKMIIWHFMGPQC